MKTTHPKPNAYLAAIALCYCTTACQNYPIKLNGNALDAKPLYTSFNIEDKHLAKCIDEHILDQHISHARDLTQLNCQQRSIRSLNGLEHFSHLTQLKLDHNPIQSVSPLLKLSRLEKVGLNGATANCAEVSTLRARGINVIGVCGSDN